jgi:heme exporter protein A
MPLTPVVAEGLRRTFSGVTVLAGVDLVVEGGECVALLGANGAGKTTLLRVLAMLLRPTGGRLRLFGEDAALRPAAALRRIGYVGHESACYGDLTAVENLAFYAELYGVSDAGRRIDDLVEWTELGRFANRPVRTFSRGMLQRVALARALLHRPELLLLDEPFTGLDPHATATLEALLVELRRAGHAIVLSTHDVPRAAALASRVVMLHRGKIDWDGVGGDGAGVAIAARFDALVATVRRA